MKAIINSSVLIFLAKLNKIELLKNLFTEIIIPEAVHNNDEKAYRGKYDN